MPNYATLTDLRQRLERTLAPLYEDHGELNESWMTADLEAIEGLVHAHLARRYAVPIAAGADLGLLRGLVLDLVVELAHRRKPGASVPPAILAAATQAREWLQGLADGRLSLGSASPAEANAELTQSLVVAGNPPVCTRRHLAGY